MTWNYRIVKRVDEWDEFTYYALHEVFYDEDGEPSHRTEEAILVMDEPKDLEELCHIISAWQAPVLEDEIFDG